MKKVFFAAVLGCLFAIVSAQSADRLRCASVETLRHDMTERIWDGRFDTALFELRAFEQQHPTINAVTVPERLLIDFWNEQYDEIFDFIADTDSAAVAAAAVDTSVCDTDRNTVKSCIRDETLWNVLTYQASEYLDDMNAWIDDAGYSAAHTRFLHSLLEDLVGNTNKTELSQDSITVKWPKYRAHLFRLAQENEEEERRTAQNPNLGTHVIDPLGNYSYWMISGGPAIMSGALTRYFNPNQMYLLTIGANKKRFLYNVQFGITRARLKRDFPVKENETEWLKGDMSSFLNLGLNLGVLVHASKSLRITPFIGIYLNNIIPAKASSEEEISPALVGVSMCIGGYAMYMFRPSRSKGGRFYLSGGITSHPWLFNSKTQFNGNLLRLELGLGWLLNR